MHIQSYLLKNLFYTISKLTLVFLKSCIENIVILLKIT